MKPLDLSHWFLQLYTNCVYVFTWLIIVVARPSIVLIDTSGGIITSGKDITYLTQVYRLCLDIYISALDALSVTVLLHGDREQQEKGECKRGRMQDLFAS